MGAAQSYLPLALLLSSLGLAAAQEDAPAGAAREPSGFAVVELFTSEGCSSCPPADALLGKIVASAREKGVAVYALAFHVDYWDRLGWPDPFADPAFSARQRRYAQALKSRRVYTPQIIVNGRGAPPASAREIQARIQRAQAETSEVALELEISQPLRTKAQATGHTLRVEFKIRGAPAGSVVNLALVERGLVTEIPRGENAGRTLAHENVVRTFQTLDLEEGDSEGSAQLSVPAGVKRELATVIAYVQEGEAMEILAASGLDLTEE